LFLCSLFASSLSYVRYLSFSFFLILVPSSPFLSSNKIRSVRYLYTSPSLLDSSTPIHSATSNSHPLFLSFSSSSFSPSVSFSFLCLLDTSSSSLLLLHLARFRHLGLSLLLSFFRRRRSCCSATRRPKKVRKKMKMKKKKRERRIRICKISILPQRLPVSLLLRGI
ncbi:hypothetical protein CSUI_011429, partial [Cystoisospora suis]